MRGMIIVLMGCLRVPCAPACAGNELTLGERPGRRRSTELYVQTMCVPRTGTTGHDAGTAHEGMAGCCRDATKAGGEKRMDGGQAVTGGTSAIKTIKIGDRDFHPEITRTVLRLSTASAPHDGTRAAQATLRYHSSREPPNQ